MTFSYQTADTAQSIGQNGSRLPSTTTLYVAVPSPEMMLNASEDKHLNSDVKWLRSMMACLVGHLGEQTPSHPHYVLPVNRHQGNGVFDGIDLLTLHGLINAAAYVNGNAEEGKAPPVFDGMGAFNEVIHRMRKDVRFLIEVPDDDPLPSDLGLESITEIEAFEDIALYGVADSMGRGDQPLREVFRDLGLALYGLASERPGITPLCINQHMDSALIRSEICPLQGVAPNDVTHLTAKERNALSGMANLAGQALTDTPINAIETSNANNPGMSFE
jgi:hypothetical protein